MVKLERYYGSSKTLEDPSNSICVLNKTKDKNLDEMNVIIGQMNGKHYQKHITCNCKCKFDGR